jgi:hypothetical protein
MLGIKRLEVETMCNLNEIPRLLVERPISYRRYAFGVDKKGKRTHFRERSSDSQKLEQLNIAWLIVTGINLGFKIAEL